MVEKEKIIAFLEKLQPSANKKEKKNTYSQFRDFLENSQIHEDDVPFIFEGNEGLLGLCELTGKTNSFGKFKDSSLKLLEIIHFMLYESKHIDIFTRAFYLLDVDFFIKMNLSDHFEAENNKSKDKKTNYSLKIINVIHSERPAIYQDYITNKSISNSILEALKELTKIDDIEKRRYTYLQKVINLNNVGINTDPQTWDDVLKLKKKILTTEFLNTSNSRKMNNDNIIMDENKELEDELIRNFVNPLTKSNERLNYYQFTPEEKIRIHVQLESFDPVFFLEKFYFESSLLMFSECLQILENNLTYINSDDGKIIDKNIYKYLDCKKLLDSILEKFQGETKLLLYNFKDNLESLQSNIINSLKPVKNSFESIMKSKNSKEIIHKFERYFHMKDEIENFLKFSSFEDLADYLKKSQDIIQDISQSTYIYGEFYEYFSQTIENIKNLLIKIIKNSMIPNVIVKNFKILLHFDVESEIIDLLLNNIKEKVCERISKYLAYTENFEIKNIKEFFMEEYQTTNFSDEYFSEVLIHADNYISGVNTDNKPEEDLDITKNSVLIKKDLINVENIIISLFKEIKDYLFMIKVIEETILLKVLNLKSKRELEFNTIIKEIYFTLFHKLGEFLFSINGNLDCMKDNYYRKCEKLGKKFADKEEINELFSFYSEKEKCTVFNDNFNKNTFQNLSNILIDILDLFELYLPGEEVLILSELKNSMVEKNFLAFLNEKFLLNMNFITEENTINFFDTNMSVYNHTFFNFTKNFLKTFCKSYKNILDFYLNIAKKIKDVTLNHQLIILTYFYTLKNFYLKFIDFYKIEEDINFDDLKKNNCLILEILKNYRFLSSEIKLITKSIFKKRYYDIIDKANELESFVNKIIEYFEDIYVKNTSKILFNTLFLDNKTNFYDKYNNFLIDTKPFTDLRSNTIDAIFILSDSVKDLYEISKQEKTHILIQSILNELFDEISDHLLKIRPKLLKNINLTIQILIELQVVFLVLNDMMNDYNLSKRKNVFYILYSIICEIRNVNNFANEFVDETVVFKDEEIQRKKKLINDSLIKYSIYVKCFSEIGKIKVNN